MNPELKMLKGLVADLPPEQREEVNRAADEIRKVVVEWDDAGKIALSIVAMEETSSADSEPEQ
jgi:predicted RNA-binding protein with RPS1 domain